MPQSLLHPIDERQMPIKNLRSALLPAIATFALIGGGAAAQSQPPPAPAAAVYALTKKEQDYDCKKLTGRIQLRILQMRTHTPGAGASAVSRGMQQAMTPVFGGTRYGTDPDAEYAADRRVLEAYNRRLVEKRCKSFDLAAALSPAAGTATPRPTVPPPPDPARAPLRK